MKVDKLFKICPHEENLVSNFNIKNMNHNRFQLDKTLLKYPEIRPSNGKILIKNIFREVHLFILNGCVRMPKRYGLRFQLQPRVAYANYL